MPTLHWIGKEKVIAHHQEVPFRVLNAAYSFGDTKEKENGDALSGNLIIHGDNLVALKSLLPRYEGRVKCIYIDPPYNTGNEGWVYNDRVNDPKILKWLHETVGKEGEDLSRHDKWLCMMYPRLRLLHQLLAPDGAIFISIDDNEQANLKLIMDEIFGGGNFVANVIWQKKFSPQNDEKFLSANHDYIVAYSKNKAQLKLNLLARKTDDSSFSNPDDDPRGLWSSGDMTSKTKAAGHSYPVVTPSGTTHFPPSGRQWAPSLATYEKWLSENRIWFGQSGSNRPRVKQFLSEIQSGIVPLSIWLRDEVGDNQGGKQELKKIFPENPFDTPKPASLIERILQIATDKDSIVLDSFAGSGTTAHAVLNLNKADGGNRKFILVEMEDYAERITAERVRRVIGGYGDKEGTGGAFTYCTIGEPVFRPEDGLLNEAVGVAKLREYVWYSEAGSAAGLVQLPESPATDLPQNKEHVSNAEGSNASNSEAPNGAASNPYLLGHKDGTDYYFYYEPGAETTLDFAFLATIGQPADTYVIYADNCLLERSFLQSRSIVFKKIPRDISRF